MRKFSHPSIGLLTVFLAVVLMSLGPPATGQVEKNFRRSADLPIERAPTQFSQRFITSDDGLANDNIQALLQARDGRLWIGTSGGLYVYDGANLMPVGDQPGPRGALPEARISALAEDRDGGLWVGTGGGLALLRDGRWRLFGTAEGLPDLDITAISISSSGRLWVGAGSRGLSVLNSTSNRFEPVPGTGTQRIETLIEDGRTERVWAGLGTGELLLVAPDGVKRSLNTRAGLPAAAITALTIMPMGDLLVGTQLGLFRLGANGRATSVAIAPSMPNAWVRALAVDKTSVWVGLNDGLGRLTPSGLALVDRGGAPFGEPVKLLTIDREGSLWAGTTAGIMVLTDRPTFTINSADGLPVNAGGLICSDPQGAIWLANDSRGLAVRPLGRTDRFRSVPGLPGTQLFGLACGRTGLWVAINGMGVGRLSGGQFTLETGWGRAQQATVITMLEDSQGRLWVGTFADGLVRRERNGRWTLLRQADGLPSGAITALFEARDGSIWIGGQGGLTIWRDGQPPRRIDEKAIPGALVMSFAQDRDGDIWIGSRSGVSLSAGGQLTSISSGTAPFAAGLALQTDRSGAIWVGSETGIVRFSKADFIRAAASPGRPFPFRRVGATDGVEGAPVWASPSSLMDIHGRLWFATTRGLAVIDPVALNTRKTAPPARLSRVALDGVDQGGGSNVRLSSDRPRLDIGFAATALTDAALIGYRYRLVGFDRDWVSTDRAQASYTNLPAGRYRLDVATRVGDGPETVSRGLAFIVQTPPFYANPWFIALCIALLAGVAVVAYRLRVSTLRTRHAAVLDERSRIARDVHDTLLQSLAGLAIQVQAVARQVGKPGVQTQAELADIAAEARRSLTEARDAVWDIRAEPGEHIEGFAAMLERVTERQTRETGIQHDIALSGSWDSRSPQMLEALSRIVQEAVRNAILHGGATTIRITGQADMDRIRLSVDDDGSGFIVDSSRSALGGHWGLLGMRERAERLGGQLILQSEPGKGTTIVVEIPG